jgi:hypothetical protein
MASSSSSGSDSDEKSAKCVSVSLGPPCARRCANSEPSLPCCESRACSFWVWATCWKLYGPEMLGLRCASAAWSGLMLRRRPKSPGMLESRLDVGAGGTAESPAASVEYMELDELWALLSRLPLGLRLKMVLPNNCTLSGRSREGMLLDVDRPEDFLDSVFPSSGFSHEGRSAEVSDRSDEEPDELVW